MSTIIGFTMRSYRSSPLYPRLGRHLAQVLAVVARWHGGEPVRKVVDGITYDLDLSEVIDSSLYYSGTFEAKAEQMIRSMLRPGMVAIDIGANIGYHTFRMAREVGCAGTVVAIEPMTRAYTRLRRNHELNAFSNIEFLHLGLSDVELGDVEVDFRANYRLDGRIDSAPERVRIATLDAIVDEQSLAKIDFIKLDVDGFEGKVLRGAQSTLNRDKPTLFFEISPAAMTSNGDNVRDLTGQLAGLGYSFDNEDGEPIRDLAAFCSRIPGDLSANVLARA
jgi:FkbM family methyltransferase